MPGIILDTNVVSEPKRARPDAMAASWRRHIARVGRLASAMPRIAATALRHDLAIPSGNSGDFALFDVPLIDPWQALG